MFYSSVTYNLALVSSSAPHLISPLLLHKISPDFHKEDRKAWDCCSRYPYIQLESFVGFFLLSVYKKQIVS